MDEDVLFKSFNVEFNPYVVSFSSKRLRDDGYWSKIRPVFNMDQVLGNKRGKSVYTAVPRDHMHYDRYKTKPTAQRQPIPQSQSVPVTPRQPNTSAFLPAANATPRVQEKSKANIPSYTKVFANTLIKHAEKDSKIIGITAAMPSGTGIDFFGEKFPKRMFDVGIAEQHAVTFAAGLATEGFKPFTAIYSTFLQRAYDQVVHDVAIQSLPVRFAIDRAGLVGADGPTHAGSFDITYLSTLPNFVVMAASDESELVKMISTSVDINDRPSAFRYPRGVGIGIELPPIDQKLEIGKGRVIQEGKKLAIINFGARLNECLNASSSLKKKGVNITIVDARFAKPLDEKLIWQIATDHDSIITIEEGSIGGFGSHVAKFLSEKNLLDTGLKFRTMILPDKFIDHDKPELMYKIAGLDSKAIEDKVMDLLNSNIVLQKQKQ